MTNYITGVTPKYKPESWMKVEAGIAGGVYGITLGQIKDYFNNSLSDNYLYESVLELEGGLNIFNSAVTEWEIKTTDDIKVYKTKIDGGLNLRLEKGQTFNKEVFISVVGKQTDGKIETWKITVVI